MAKKVCNSCATPSTVPYAVFHEMKETSNRTIKRLWVLLIIAWAIILCVVGAFTYERLQYDYAGETTNTETVYAQDGSGTSIIGDSNEVNNNGSKVED